MARTKTDLIKAKGGVTPPANMKPAKLLGLDKKFKGTVGKVVAHFVSDLYIPPSDPKKWTIVTVVKTLDSFVRGLAKMAALGNRLNQLQALQKAETSGKIVTAGQVIRALTDPGKGKTAHVQAQLLYMGAFGLYGLSAPVTIPVSQRGEITFYGAINTISDKKRLVSFMFAHLAARKLDASRKGNYCAVRKSSIWKHQRGRILVRKGDHPYESLGTMFLGIMIAKLGGSRDELYAGYDAVMGKPDIVDKIDGRAVSAKVRSAHEKLYAKQGFLGVLNAMRGIPNGCYYGSGLGRSHRRQRIVRTPPPRPRPRVTVRPPMKRRVRITTRPRPRPRPVRPRRATMAAPRGLFGGDPTATN